MSDVDVVSANQQAWEDADRVERYRGHQGWVDDGERLGVNAIADEVRGQPVLDIGVGAGRTVWLMRLLTDDYVGVDYAETMVDVCRRSCPGVDIRRVDARDLSGFPADHFKLVLFSYNGIDTIDHDGRSKVYDEVARVLRPDGIFAYSTLSKDGALYGQKPWTQGAGQDPLRRVARALANASHTLPEAPRRLSQWSKANARAEDHGWWGMAPLAAVGYNLVHFTTVEGEKKTLAAHGFTAASVITSTGQPVHEGAARAPWFFVVARPVR